MTALEDIIFISLQDGYYNISLYRPNENINGVDFIKSGEPFIYKYDGVTFKIFEEYSEDKNYAITVIYAFEQQMKDFPPYLYKFDYEELAYLAIREIFKISLKKYEEIFESSLKKYKKVIPNKIKMPLFKIVFSDCYRTIKHKGTDLYEYFRDAIAQNETFFGINADNLTIDFASNVYPYYLYYKTIYVGVGAPLKLEPEFEHCIFDIGYTTITCYIYYFETQEMEEKLAKLVQSEKRSVITSHKLKKVFVIPSGIFSFISSIYYEIIEKDKPKMIHSNSSYDYSSEVQKLIPEIVRGLSTFNQTKTTNGVIFKDSNNDDQNIYLKDIFETSIMKIIVKQISNIIKSFNIDSCLINTMNTFNWFFDQFLKLQFFATDNCKALLINSLFYRYGIINNLLYQVDILKEFPEENKSVLKADEIIYDEPNKRFCRKRTSMFPDLRIDTETDGFKLDLIEDINNYIKLSKYVDELNEKHEEILRIKIKYQKNHKKKLEEKYGKKLVNGMYNKLLMLAMNEPTLLEKYVDDFAEKPETYL